MGRGLLFLGILITYTSMSLALYKDGDLVTQLSDESFDGNISQPGVTVVKLYASWCIHCENFAIQFKKAARVLQGVVHFGVVDNEAHGDIGKRLNVEAYPTVLVYRSDKSVENPIKYSGARTAEALIEFLMQQVNEYITNNSVKEGIKLESMSKFSSSGSSSGKCGGSRGYSEHQGSTDNSQYGGTDATVTLTDQNFDSNVLKSSDDWLVAFIAPWCGHCQNLKPEWLKAAEQLRGKVKVGTVDATVHTALASRYQIKGFPTIKYFKSGQVEEYNGGRSAEDIVQFGLHKAAMNKPPPEVKEITSNDILHEACDKQLCIIGFLPHLLDCQSKCRQRYLDVMKDAAKKHKEKDWGWLWSGAGSQKKLEESLQIGGFGYPAMVAVNLRKQRFAVMHGSFAADGVRDFLYELIQGRGTSTLSVLTALPDIEDSKPWDGKDAPIVHEEEIDLSELGIKVEL